MALENRADVRLIFFDISKAFDKVWHKGLLHIIKGIESLYRWFEDYLTNSKQRVVLNGKNSSGRLSKLAYLRALFLARSYFLFISMTLDTI